MDSRDLRNLSEAWAAATSCEDLCEDWVQQKLGEGFEFSQYTVEELSSIAEEEILSEQGNPNRRGQGSTSGAAQSQALQNIGQRFQSFANRGGIAGFLNRRLQSAVAQGGNPNRRGQGSGNRPAVAAAPVRPAAPVATTPVRPAAPVATTPVRPAAPVAAKPTGDTAPAKPAGGAVADKVTPAAPARRSIAQDLADLRAMRMRSQDRIIAQGGKPATGPVPGSDKNLKDANRAARQYMKQDADLFDIVKGYLLDEGATEEEALKRMAIMTEEERNEIIESSCGGGHSKKKKKKSGY